MTFLRHTDLDETEFFVGCQHSNLKDKRRCRTKLKLCSKYIYVMLVYFIELLMIYFPSYTWHSQPFCPLRNRKPLFNAKFEVNFWKVAQMKMWISASPLMKWLENGVSISSISLYSFVKGGKTHHKAGKNLRNWGGCYF